MAPPVNSVKFEVADEMENQYLNITNTSQNSKNVDPSYLTTDVAVNEEAGAEVAYFVDEEGRYYYQAVSSVQKEKNSTFTLKSEDSFQTVTLDPSEIENGELSYLVVVQESDKELIVIEENSKKPRFSPVYEFDEEDESDKGSTDEDNEDITSMRLSKKREIIRPQYTCTYCKYTSPKRYLLLRHMKTHSGERPHRCAVCDRGFKYVASLQNHVNTHTGVKPHACKECNRRFTTSGELVRHVRYKHTHEKPHRCSECSYASVELSKLRRHVRCHTGERPYQCPHCTYASADTFKLKRHLRTHTGEKPYECGLCEMRFTQSNSLKNHQLIHNSAARPVFACELCPTTCSRKTDLRVHVQKLHTAGRLHKCKTCGKCFSDRYSCRIHTKTHQGEKAFKCAVCPYAAPALRRLRAHALTHTGEKPFTCDQCDAAFRQKQLLRRHHNLYHDPEYVPPPPKKKAYECEECDRRFAHRGNLLRHLATHEPAATADPHRILHYVCADALDKVHEASHQDQEKKRNDDIEFEEISTSAKDDETYVVEVIQSENIKERTVDAADSKFYVKVTINDLEGRNEKRTWGPDTALADKSMSANQQKLRMQNEILTCFGF